MESQWLQNAIVGLMVAGAIFYLLRRYLPHCRKNTHGNCEKCSGGKCH